MEIEKKVEKVEKAEEFILLFVGGVPGKVTKEELKSYFLRYGEVVSVKANKARKKKKPSLKHKGLEVDELVQGHAYVKMKDPQVARALIEMQEMPIDKNRTLHIEAAVARSEKKKYKQEVEKLRVFIGNLPATLSIEMLKSHFMQFGGLKKLYKIYDHFNHVDKDYGYVIFQDTESVAEVLRYEYHKVGKYFVRVAPFIPKSEQNSAKGGYPYSDQQYPKKISVFDPNFRRKRFEATLGSDGRISNFRQETPALRSMGTYSYNQGSSPDHSRLENHFPELSEASENFSPGTSHRDNVMEWNIKHWQEREIQVKPNLHSQINSFKRSNSEQIIESPTPNSPSLKGTIRKTHFDISKEKSFLEENTRTKNAKKGKMFGGLTIVEEKRPKSQHLDRPDPKTQILDQSIANYRLNILNKTRDNILQLHRPLLAGGGSITALTPQTFLEQKNQTEAGDNTEAMPPHLADLDAQALEQAKD